MNYEDYLDADKGICNICGNECEPFHKSRQINNRCWDCHTCNIRYVIDKFDRGLETITFGYLAQNEKSYYQIRMNLDLKMTRVYCSEDNDLLVVMELGSLILGLTPDNVENKLKTLLLFS